MTIDYLKILGLGVIAFLAFTVYTHGKQPVSDIRGLTPVHQNRPNLNWWKAPGDSEGTFEAKDNAGKHLASFATDRSGVLYPEDGQSNIQLTYTPNYYGGRTVLDLGGWAGFAPGYKEHPAQIGLRVSPVRLIESVAPEIVVSHDLIGVGATYYFSRNLVGPSWSKVGLGFDYCASFDGTFRGPVFTVATSTF